MTPILSLYLSWAITALWPINAKLAGLYCDPLLFGFLHLAIGTVALAPWLAVKGRWKPLVDRKLLVPFVVLGGLGSGMTSALMQVAKRRPRRSCCWGPASCWQKTSARPTGRGTS